MLEALPGLRLGEVDFMQAKGHQVDHQMEPIIAAGGAWALHRSPITRKEAEGLGHSRPHVQREQPFEQRFEKRGTPRETLPNRLIGNPLGMQRQRAYHFPSGLIRPAIKKKSPEEFLRRLELASIPEGAKVPHHDFPVSRKGTEKVLKLLLYVRYVSLH